MILTMDTLHLIKMYFFKSIKIVKIIAYLVSYWYGWKLTSDKNDQKDQNDNKFINQEWSWLMILTINTIQMIKMYFYFFEYFWPRCNHRCTTFKNDQKFWPHYFYSDKNVFS